MHHMAAFYSAAPTAAALTPLAAVREEMYFTNGNDFRVPKGLANIIGEAALSTNAMTQAQIQSPSLRSVANLDIEPGMSAAMIFGDPFESLMHPEAPVPLMEGESLNLAVNAAAAAAPCAGLIVLADGMPKPVTGPQVQIRATATITGVAGAWTNGALALGQTLPVGQYAVVGMRARGASLIAARLVFPEQSARPGVFACNAIGNADYYWNRSGRLGQWGVFDSTVPPSLDVFDGTGGALPYVVVLDLIRI